MRRLPTHVLIAVAIFAFGLVVSAPVAACSLDGIASISANGVLAVRTTDTPNPNALARWAPFTFGLAMAPNVDVRFGEDMAKVRRSLPPVALTTPFRWIFDDAGAAGTVVRGTQVTHRYRTTGWYKVSVWSYWPSRRAWVLFDSARAHIVPASALLQANAGFSVVLALAFLTKALAYGGFLVFLLVPLAWRLRRRRRRRARTPHQGVAHQPRRAHHA